MAVTITQEKLKQLKGLRRNRMTGLLPRISAEDEMCSDCTSFYNETCDRCMPVNCQASLDIRLRELFSREGITEQEKEVYKRFRNPVEWAKLIFGWEARWYQEGVLRCTALRKLFRGGRRVGKTSVLSVDALHRAATKSREKILIICPFQDQVNIVFHAIREFISDSNGLIEVVRDIGNPQRIEFANGSYILGITAGVHTGMKGAKSRGQDATAIYLDEMDLLDQETLEALLAILASRADCFIWASGTPTGERKLFYSWATDKDQGFKEYHFKSDISPEWRLETEIMYRNTYSELAYMHEFDAEFGEAEAGVYRREKIDSSLRDYRYEDCHRVWENGYLYVLGVDWNAAKNGVHMLIVEYNPHTYKMKVVKHESMEAAQYTQTAAVERIIALHKEWKFDYIYADQGYGSVQIEQLHLYGAKHPASKLGEIVKGIAMRSNLVIKDPFTNQDIKKNAKHLMVELSARRLECGQCILPKHEDVRNAFVWRMRNFKSLRTSVDGIPVYSTADGHALVAWQLAIMALIMEFTSFGKPTYTTKVSFVDIHEKYPVSEGTVAEQYKKEQTSKRKRLAIVPRSASITSTPRSLRGIANRHSNFGMDKRAAIVPGSRSLGKTKRSGRTMF